MNFESSRREFPASSLLSLCELFSDVSPTVLRGLAGELQIVHLSRGEILFREDEPSDCMYAIVSGRLQLVREAADGTEGLLTELRSGETVGVIELIDGRPRMTMVRGLRQSLLVRVTRLGFERLVLSSPDSLCKLARIMASHVRAVTKQSRSATPTIRTIAVLGGGGASSGFDFGAKLSEALGAFGEVLHLSEDRYQKLYGRPFQSTSGIAARLSEMEEAYRFVVLEVNGDQRDFARHCMGHADLVLTVCRSWLPPKLATGESLLFREKGTGITAASELILLHKERGRVFSGTSKWLAERPVSRHHHVRIGESGDIRRLARVLAGSAIGLVLGGGGARGFAHIGVIRAIEEAGIPIDMICGVSMGSIIACQYAMGWDWQKMLRANRTGMGESGIQTDFTLPLVSLSSGRKFRRVLKEFCGDVQLEDLSCNFFCTSCNLSTSEIHVHRRGALWSAICASNAVPAIFPPVLADGHLLVDGGILNNLPGDLLKPICGGPVIVSNVSPLREVTLDSSYTEMPSAWQVLWSRLNPFKSSIKVPGIPATMIRALMVASNRKSREVEKDADFYLRPPIDRFRLDDMGRVEEIAEVGYQYAKKEVTTWKEQERLTRLRCA